MNIKRLFLAALMMGVLVFAVGQTSKASSQTGDMQMHEKSPTSPTMESQDPGRMDMQEGMMGDMVAEEGSDMGSKQQMMKHMQETNTKLSDLVAQMNAAKGNAKVDAIATVVSELVKEQNRLRQNMLEMQPEMMQQMKNSMSKSRMDGGAHPSVSMMNGMGMASTEPSQPVEQAQTDGRNR